MKIVIATLIAVLVGCAALELKRDAEQKALQEAFAKASIQYATAKIVRHNPELKEAMLHHVVIMKDMLANGISFESVRDYGMRQVSMGDMLFEDRILITNLIDIARASIVDVSAQFGLSKENVGIRALDWVKEAVEMMPEGGTQ